MSRALTTIVAAVILVFSLPAISFTQEHNKRRGQNARLPAWRIICNVGDVRRQKADLKKMTRYGLFFIQLSILMQLSGPGSDRERYILNQSLVRIMAASPPERRRLSMILKFRPSFDTAS